MDNVERFAAYAAAFEEFYVSNDNAVLEPYFTEDAVYETISPPPFNDRSSGRDAVFAQMKESLSTMDKRFDSRELELLEGPTVRGDSVWIRWRATYRIGDLPDMVIEGEETATFDAGRICRLEDRFTDEASQGVVDWMNAYSDRLAPLA